VSPRDQRAIVSQLLRWPLLRPRAWIWTHEPAGVVASQDGISSVSPNPGEVHGEVHWPNEYLVVPPPGAAYLRLPTGVPSRSRPFAARAPAKVPFFSSAVLAHWA